MGTIRFEPVGVQLRIAERERVLDVVDDYEGAVLPFACRSAHCASCLVQVLEGAESLLPPEQAEQRTLDAIGARPGQRLGCQLCVRDSEARVVVRGAYI